MDESFRGGANGRIFRGERDLSILIPWQGRHKRKGEMETPGENDVSCGREEISHLLSLEEMRWWWARCKYNCRKLGKEESHDLHFFSNEFRSQHRLSFAAGKKKCPQYLRGLTHCVVTWVHRVSSSLQSLEDLGCWRCSPPYLIATAMGREFSKLHICL